SRVVSGLLGVADHSSNSPRYRKAGSASGEKRTRCCFGVLRGNFTTHVDKTSYVGLLRGSGLGRPGDGRDPAVLWFPLGLIGRVPIPNAATHPNRILYWSLWDFLLAGLGFSLVGLG